MVRALASYQCGPGSTPSSGVKCGLSLLVLCSAPRGFLRVLRFPLKPKFDLLCYLLISVTVSVISAPALEVIKFLFLLFPLLLKLEPVSSSSRRGARAAYLDGYPRDIGPRIAYTVSLVSDTSRPPTLCRPSIRQGGRAMSAPRPYETDPFHPPALFAFYSTVSFNIYTEVSQFFLPYDIYVHCVLVRCTFVLYTSALPKLLASSLGWLVGNYMPPYTTEQRLT